MLTYVRLRLPLFVCRRHTPTSTIPSSPALCLQFDRLVPNAWRVANSNDAVTLLPRLCGYCHVGHKAQLRAEGRVELTRKPPACRIDLPPGLPTGLGNHLKPTLWMLLVCCLLQGTAARRWVRAPRWQRWRLRQQSTCLS